MSLCIVEEDIYLTPLTATYLCPCLCTDSSCRPAAAVFREFLYSGSLSLLEALPEPGHDGTGAGAVQQQRLQ